jgi:hypothetical protein
MGTLRTQETKQKYQKFIDEGLLADGCNLCKSPAVVEFKYWRIINNEFPYDLISDVHHMIVTKRHITEDKLNTEEKEELQSLKLGYINKEYEFMMEGTNRKKTIPEHFHVHLITVKENNYYLDSKV